MKILSIGNSFSTDAHKWLHKLAEINGYEIEAVNLFIGGCSIETHWKNYCQNNSDYSLEINGNDEKKLVSISDALLMKKWDVITFQQASALSGMAETYEPYLSNLVAEVRKNQPEANFYFHQTWAYETDSLHEGFLNYNQNQKEMFQKILHTSETAADLIGAKIIPVGSVIQKIRESVKNFDYENGGLSLCRDGFHLSFDYGRFAASAVWLHTLTGKKIKCDAFENFDTTLIKKIIEVVNN